MLERLGLLKNSSGSNLFNVRTWWKRLNKISKGTDAIIDAVLFLRAKVFQLLSVQIIKGAVRPVA